MATSRAGGFDAFIARAWADHATRADAVARRLRVRTPAPRRAAHLHQLVHLVVHLLGEHLGRFGDARWRLAALRNHALADETVQSALRVGQATLDLGEGRPADTAALSAAEILRAQSAAAALCAGRGEHERALDLVASARTQLAGLPQATADDHRPLAVACNNIAWELRAMGERRSPAQTQAMLHMAGLSREYWSQAGTWLHIERADYCLAMTHLSAGLHDDAWRHAAQCLAVCLRHQAPPLEHLYAHEAMARVHHARREAAELAHHAQAMRAAFDSTTGDERATCREALDAVQALRV
jgi:hypothetical protein